MSDVVVDANALELFAFTTLGRAGLEETKAATVARILLEGDLLGHTTHGLQLLGPYIAALKSGGMTGTGLQDVIQDRQASALWDGRLLPGPWLIAEAFSLGVERARTFGTFTLTIRRSHHTACLAAYLHPVVAAGMVGIIAVSDPTVANVAPFGGIEPLYSPNPYAAGYPTQNGPVLVDISMSQTTNGMTQRLYRSGEHFENPWLLDSQGNPSRDPAVCFTNPPGSLLPLGGLDNGHKGYAMGLLVEALTNGLAGYGRADTPNEWQAGVFIQVIDPSCFGGLDAFARETGWLANKARATTPRDPGQSVRVPGERGLRLRETMLKEGVRLSAEIYGALKQASESYEVPLPAARNVDEDL